MVHLTRSERRTIEGVDPASWNALAHAPSPFLEFGFLRALEISGSVGEDAGWDPHYLLVEGELPQGSEGPDLAQGTPPDQAGSTASAAADPRSATRGQTLLGAVVAYVKDHSYGEYIFDFQWARASMQAGLRYYPKLVIAAPATPATGTRILLHPQLDQAGRDAVAASLIEGVRELAEARQCNSIHWLFTSKEERDRLVDAGFAARASYQFHWHNRDYDNFDDFLGALTSRKRKQIRKERKRARASIDSVRFIPGPELSEQQRGALDRFYRRTTNLYHGRQYLRRGFFDALLELAPERVRFLEVARADKPVAGALFFETEQGLYGRYWGCDEEIEFLHFEAAYYAGIERCIDLGLPLFEAGAQGEHKLLRGFLPNMCHSAHWFRHPGLDQGVRQFLQEEMQAVTHHIEQLAGYGPYRKA